MWQLKAVISAENTAVGRVARKHKVVLQLYPLMSGGNNKLLINVSGVVCGSQENIARFMKELASLSQMKHIKRYNNYFVCQYLEKSEFENFYNKEVFYIEPWTINGVTNEHNLHLGSWKKEHLTELYDTLRHHHKGNILKIVRGEAPDLFLFTTFPKLTSKQREAIELAVQNGYYEQPRKVGVQELAKISRRSFSTFHAHLRKAEKKLISPMMKAVLSDIYR